MFPESLPDDGPGRDQGVPEPLLADEAVILKRIDEGDDHFDFFRTRSGRTSKQVSTHSANVGRLR